jgi:putative transcriptional regulator
VIAFGRFFSTLAGFVLGLAASMDAAQAGDVSHAVTLVASERLAGSPFEKTVILAAPLAQGGHVGVVLNRPMGVKLESIFPEQEAAHGVLDQVYAGGPMLPDVLIAVTREAPADNRTFVPLMPGLVAVLDGATVDRIIEKTPNAARYFLGLVVWPPGALEEQVDRGAWRVRGADSSLILPGRHTGLWESLGGVEI